MEIVVVKPLKELYTVFQWMFENVRGWETTEFVKGEHQRVGHGYIGADKEQNWKNFDFKKYWAIQSFNQDYIVGCIFKFQKSNDAMLFKLRWG